MAALDASASFDASAIAKAQDETLAEAERLNVLPAPEKTPFENKYAARKLLQERCEVLQAALPGAGTTTPWVRALLGECEAALGDIGYDVEEPHAADPCYARALAALAPGAEALDDSGDHGDEDASEEARLRAAAADEETAEDIAVASAARVRDAALVGAPKHARGAELGAAALRALNGAAVLWQGREQPRRAFRLLKAAEALERLPSLPGGAGFSADTLREAETKTIYYLAQVCASLGDGAASANYCAQTLERQLVGPAPSFDGVTPLDWAKNCVGLARFFVDQGAVLDAMSCCRAGVAAARLDGVDDDPDEPRGSVVADAHKCWAQAHVSRAASFFHRFVSNHRYLYREGRSLRENNTHTIHTHRSAGSRYSPKWRTAPPRQSRPRRRSRPTFGRSARRSGRRIWWTASAATYASPFGRRCALCGARGATTFWTAL